MDTPTAGNLLREVARLHVHSQREQVVCCNGTTSTQCLILTEVGRNGPMTLADLGRRTSLDKGWLSRAVETLVQAGLLTKALGDADRRTIRIALSPVGETRFQQLQASETWSRRISDEFLDYTPCNITRLAGFGNLVDALIGSAGLERYGDIALLRSVVVAIPERGHHLGQTLVQQLLAYAASLEVRQVVLLTTTAADFFLRFFVSDDQPS